jgi:membrane protease YdiL (CAAX protease family)
MRRFRISIAGLLVAVAVLGVAIAALVYPSPLAANAFHSMTLATLTIAVLAAVYHRGAKRAFWVGFSTCGWAYFLAVFGPEPLSHVGPGLVTTTILNVVYPYTVPSTVAAAALDPVGSSTPSARLYRRVVRDGAKVVLTGGFGVLTGPPVPPPTPWEIWTRPDRMTQFNQSSPRMFQRVGHSLFCLIFAMIGGTLTRRFRMALDQESATPA